MAEESQQPATDKVEPPPPIVGGSEGPVLLKGEIEIYPDQRLPHLDQGPVKAYAAASRSKEKAYALLCERALIPQINNSAKYLTITNASMPRLIGAGIVDWRPTRQQKYVFIYENKLGLPLANPSNFMAMGFKADTVFHGVVKKFGPLLKNMRDLEFVHGNIRINNLFTGGGNNFDKIMLGECLSTPPAMMYAPVYETIERAAADPLGRGVPSYSDDIYSLGVMLAIMIRSADPMAGWSNDDILAHKIEHGTYAALMGRERVTGSLLELLRGILNDDLKQRWVIDDVMTWLDGQRVTHKQTATQRLKAARPFEFNGEKFLRPQLLAVHLNRHPSELVELHDKGDLKQWLNRSIQDKNLEEKVEHAINAAKELGASGDAYAQRVAGFVAAAMGPNMPIFYRNLKFLPEAFGRLLAEAVAMHRDLNPFAEIIQSSLLSFWSTTADQSQQDVSEVINRFETCRAFLRQNGMGYGIERCLYHLAPEAPCMSEKLKDFYVRSPEEFLLAYEQLSSTSVRPENFFDRHIVAFLSVKDRAVIDPYIPDLNSNEPHRVIQASLRIFASIQRRGKMPPLPGVGAWLCEKIDPLINRFHDREQRVKLKAQAQKLKDKGDLTKIEQIFDNVQAVQADFNAFKAAMREYINLKQEAANVTENLENNPKFGYGAGRQASALISGIIASIIVLGYLFIKLTSTSGF